MHSNTHSHGLWNMINKYWSAVIQVLNQKQCQLVQVCQDTLNRSVLCYHCIVPMNVARVNYKITCSLMMSNFHHGVSDTGSQPAPCEQVLLSTV